jgi:hypothetical protein
MQIKHHGIRIATVDIDDKKLKTLLDPTFNDKNAKDPGRAATNTALCPSKKS